MPFTFLLALGAVAAGILLCVNVKKSRIECRQYLEDEAERVYRMRTRRVSVASLHSVPSRNRAANEK